MYIGIDVGGMSIKAGIVDNNGSILAKHSVPTPRDGNESFLNAIKTAIDEVLKKHPLDEISSIGIGAPGIVDRENGVLIYSTNIGYKNVPVREFLGKEYGCEVYVENDANSAALGEFYAASGKKNFVFITLGTGVGGGVILNGKLYTGSNGVGAELGHIVTHARGRKCGCGRSGCWESYASVTALMRFTEEAHESLGIGEEEISGKTVFEEAAKGNAAAIEVRDMWIEEVSIGITNIVNNFQPEEIVIGGAISKEGETLLLPIREYVDANEYCAKHKDIKITKINLPRAGDTAGILGAAYIGRNIKE